MSTGNVEFFCPRKHLPHYKEVFLYRISGHQMTLMMYLLSITDLGLQIHIFGIKFKVCAAEYLAAGRELMADHNAKGC